MSARGRETEYIGGGGGAGVAQGGGGYQPRQVTGGDASAQQRQMLRYQFSPEELKAIRECNRESFYYRCLPLGTLLGVGTFYGVRYGYLKPSVRFGAGPKMFMASVVGYFIGKFSYQQHCAEKLMALPNSQLGETLRKQKGRMGFQESLSMEPGFASAAPVGSPAFPNSDLNQSHGHVYSDVGDTRPMSSFDSEGSSNISGYDYSQPSSNYDTTQQMLDDENLPPKRPQFFTSYDDLRRQNRIDYESRQHNRHHPSPPPTPAVAPPPTVDSRSPAEGVGYYESRRNQSSSTYSPPNDGLPTKARNKYGDVWDDKPGSY